MKNSFFTVAIFIILTAPCYSQEPVPSDTAKIQILSTPIKLITACMNDAIGVGSLDKIGKGIQFKCGGDTARDLYDNLQINAHSNTSGNTEWLSKTINKATNNLVPPSECSRIITFNGKSSNEYVCDLQMFVGSYLNQ